LRALDAKSAAERRSELLREQPALVGSSWAQALYTEVLASRGSVEGGWPGTVAEARSRVLRTLPVELASQGLPPLEPAEVAAAVSAAYAHARQRWQKALKPSRLGSTRPDVARRENHSPCSDGPAAVSETSRASIEK
jgi:hypothetical protein